MFSILLTAEHDSEAMSVDSYHSAPVLSTVFVNVFTDQSQKVVFILASFDLDFNLSSTIHSSFTLFHNPDAQCLPKMLVRA